MARDISRAVAKAAATALAVLMVAVLALLLVWACAAIVAGIAHTLGGI